MFRHRWRNVFLDIQLLHIQIWWLWGPNAKAYRAGVSWMTGHGKRMAYTVVLNGNLLHQLLNAKFLSINQSSLLLGVFSHFLRPFRTQASQTWKWMFWRWGSTWQDCQAKVAIAELQDVSSNCFLLVPTITHPKFNSTPLKSYRAPIGK